MNIKIEKRIREKYHQGFEREISDINTVVIHGTAGGNSAKGLIKWMLSGEREEQYKRGIALFHYLIDKNGKIYEIINPDRWVYHSSSGSQDQHTIGIELINSGKNNEEEYTTKQYIALWKLLFGKIGEKYNIKRIIGHGAQKRKWSGGYKNCPGNFEWFYLGAAVKLYDYKISDFNKDEERIDIEKRK